SPITANCAMFLLPESGLSEYIRSNYVNFMSTRVYLNTNFVMTSLFEPVRLGAVSLKNRIVMAPLTRTRAAPGRIPNELMRQYYCQRASAGLIVTEATSISPQGVGYPNTPGVWCH